MTASREETDDPDSYRMPLGDHLDELRRRLLRSLLCIGAALIVCWVFRGALMAVMVRPHRVTMRALGLPEPLRILKYQEGFYAYMKLALLAALVIASPYVIAQIWAYVRSGLFRHERHLAAVYGAVSVGFFLAGVAFGFFVLIPLGLQFLIRVSGGVAQPMIALSDYLSLVTMLTLVTGIVFELPLVMRFLSRLGVISADVFRRRRGPAILIAFILAACLTPPDPFTQILLAVPMVALYELGIVVAEPKRPHVIRFGAGVLVGLLVFAGVSSHAKSRDLNAARVGDDRVAVGSALKGGGRVDFRNGGRVWLQEGTRARLTARRVLKVRHGQIFAEAGEDDGPLRIRTPDVDVVLRNAQGNVRVTADATEVTCIGGQVTTLFEGVEGAVLAGRQKRFAAGGERVDVREVLTWTERIGNKEGRP